MLGVCTQTECTVAATGTCLLDAAPAECEHFKPQDTVEPELPPAQTATAPKANTARRFHTGMELGLEEAAELMRNQYCRLVGVMGSAAVGKTSLLSSLYLLASQREGVDSDLLFAGSNTLQGFEERCRGVREWSNGTLPTQLVDRTQLRHPRVPSLMHIAFCATASSPSDRLNFLFTDLPGEWFDSLVDRADVATRLQFLQRADGVVLMLDGPRFASSGTRHLEVQRSERLLERLFHAVKLGLHIPFVIAVSKRDLIESIPPAIDQVVAKARELGFSPIVVELTSFSTRPDVFPNGAGVREILRMFLTPPAQTAPSLEGGTGTRWYQRYGAIGRT